MNKIFNAYDIHTDLRDFIWSCEKQVELNGVCITKYAGLLIADFGTSVITTNYKISTAAIALHVFTLGPGKIFFRYMRQEADIDRIIQYGVDE